MKTGKGILAGGNWIIDEVSMIDTYPKEENLANILTEYSSNGGAAYNVLKDLSQLGALFPLAGIGLVGRDERGQRILEDCREFGIAVDRLKETPHANTSYTNVVTVQGSGKRTFFHQRGANALLNESDFDFSPSAYRIFHLGYLLLLDSLDITDPTGCTGASKVLKKAGEMGLITSADVVSEHSDRFREIVYPALPYIDYLFINEYEAMKVSGIPTSEGNEVNPEACIKAALKIKTMGVREWVILHFPCGAVAVKNEDELIFQRSVDLPAEKIRGTVGAGDALAAGVLFGVHEGWPMARSLRLGVCAAAACLMAPTSSEGILHWEECMRLPNLYGFKE